MNRGHSELFNGVLCVRVECVHAFRQKSILFSTSRKDIGQVFMFHWKMDLIEKKISIWRFWFLRRINIWPDFAFTPECFHSCFILNICSSDRVLYTECTVHASVSIYLPLDVFQHVFMSLEKVQMLELCIISLRLHQATLLNVHYLTETI